MSTLRQSHAQDIKVDQGMYNHVNEDGHSHPPFRKWSTVRRLKRLLKRFTRRHVVVLLIFAFLVLVTFSSTRSITPFDFWGLDSVFECPSTRPKHHAIPPLELKDPAPMSRTWDGLHILFDAHPPTPTYIPHPHHASDLDFPFHDGLRDIMNLTASDAHLTRIAHTSIVRSIPPYPEDWFTGQGIIMLAGGKYSEFAATSLGMLRAVGSLLPVEVWMKDRSEEEPGWCDELAREGMSCRRLQDYMDMSVLSHPYQWKSFVMLFSSFEEFIFLDADDMPIRNPDTIFDSDIYRKNGAIIWPDYWKHTGTPWLPYIIGLSETNSTMLEGTKSAESGQVVWNKRRHWKSLCLAMYYNYHGAQAYYSILNQGWAGWGDKDTFPTALRALDEPFFQVSSDIITVFVDGTLLGIGMVQADPANETNTMPMFLHSNIVKWSMRDFLCVGCPPTKGNLGVVGHMENPGSPINRHLIEGKRVFATNQLSEHGMDPEPLIWKVMEHTACRSVWGNSQVCQQARDHMSKTFGFKFKSGRLAKMLGYSRVCVIDP